MTLTSWGRFNKVCFQSHALEVIFDDVLGGCQAVHVHLHQFVVQAVGLVETLAEFCQLKVLGPDVLQVRQLGLLIDAISPTDVALTLDDHEIEKLDLSGKLGDLPVKSFCYFLSSSPFCCMAVCLLHGYLAASFTPSSKGIIN